MSPRKPPDLSSQHFEGLHYRYKANKVDHNKRTFGHGCRRSCQRRNCNLRRKSQIYLLIFYNAKNCYRNHHLQTPRDGPISPVQSIQLRDSFQCSIFQRSTKFLNLNQSHYCPQDQDRLRSFQYEFCIRNVHCRNFLFELQSKLRVQQITLLR